MMPDQTGIWCFGLFSERQMVKEFNDFCFEGRTGDKGVVNQYGYHYIEIEDQKDFEQAYKIAYLSKPVGPSVEADRAARRRYAVCFATVLLKPLRKQ